MHLVPVCDAAFAGDRDTGGTVLDTSQWPKFGSCCQFWAGEQTHARDIPSLPQRSCHMGFGGSPPDEAQATQVCWHGERKAAGEAVP